MWYFEVDAELEPFVEWFAIISISLTVIGCIIYVFHEVVIPAIKRKRQLKREKVRIEREYDLFIRQRLNESDEDDFF